MVSWKDGNEWSEFDKWCEIYKNFYGCWKFYDGVWWKDNGKWCKKKKVCIKEGWCKIKEEGKSMENVKKKKVKKIWKGGNKKCKDGEKWWNKGYGRWGWCKLIEENCWEDKKNWCNNG